MVGKVHRVHTYIQASPMTRLDVRTHLSPSDLRVDDGRHASLDERPRRLVDVMNKVFAGRKKCQVVRAVIPDINGHGHDALDRAV